MVKASINSLCPHPLVCIRWFPPTHFAFFGKDAFPTKYIPKSGLGRIPNLGHFPPPPNHTLFTLLAIGPTPLAWLGCKGAKPKPYLTDLPFYSCLFSDFGFFLLHVLSTTATFVFFHRVSCWG